MRRWAIGLLACVCACSSDTAPVHPGPSVIFISIDTLRADHMGAYGYERDTTPNLDRLAAESVRFERAYTTMSFTLIAHMGMLTGLYPSQHKVWNVDSVLPTSVPTLAQRLQAEGFYTLGLYRPHWLNPRFGYGRGFDVYEPHENAAQADAHLERYFARRPLDRPFFLFVHLFDVHNVPMEPGGNRIYGPPAPYDRMFLEDAPERLANIDANRLWEESAIGVGPAVHEAIVAQYDGCVRYVDDMLGRWLARWRESGVLDDCIVIVTSDHGEGLAQRYGDPYKGHGQLFEEGLRVPLLVRYPGAEFAGQRDERVVSQVDLVPTLLERLGLAPDARLPGASLLSELPEGRTLYAGDRWHEALIRWPLKVVQERGATEGKAFDLEVDPREERSIRTERGLDAFLEAAGPLREAAEQQRSSWFAPAQDGQAQPLDARALEELRALGYSGEDH